MKHKMRNILVLLSLTSLVFASDTISDEEHNEETKSNFRWGIGPVIGSDGFGLSNRFWIKERFGASINIKSCWNRDIEGGELQLNYKFNNNWLIKPYLLAGGGVQRLELLDRDPVINNEPVGVFTVGAGAEALLGESKRHGVSLEIAYLNGGIEYKAKSETTMGDIEQQSSTRTVSVTPFGARLLYHFYILPSVEKDSDGDGILNRVDKCPNESEDFDGFMDEDGCPELDNDNDGIEDASDNCPSEAEDIDSFNDEDGCPDLDNDNDGIKDSEDNCADEAEDIDGFEDEDGCPELDNDNDDINDANDNCPNEAETMNSFEDEDGCPDDVPVKEEVIEQEISDLPVDLIAFMLGSAELTDSSLLVLEEIAEFLNNWPTVKLEIQGHTDNSGNEIYNKYLSQQRAEAVVIGLIDLGISNERLNALGYGQEMPLASNETREGRIKNRRVELKITE